MLASVRVYLASVLQRCAASAWFYYATLLALQTKVLWGIWAHRDLTPGDTSAYFITAEEFSRNLTCMVHWSPLYTSFLGSFLWFGGGPYLAVTAHRVVIVAVVSFLVYELLRRLVPRPLAWYLAAWWILLPINHETLYEIHLFSLIPILITWLVLLRVKSPVGRGAGVGALLLTAFLVRNEIAIAFGLFSLLALRHDLRGVRWRRTDIGRWKRVALSYGIPATAALALLFGAYTRSTVQFPELPSHFEGKHTVNIAQIYAFGHGQRNPDYQSDPWTDYAELMETTFGDELVTMKEALFANPNALLDHFLWNASLIPSGIQVSLFNARTGEHNPDYVRTRRASWVWVCTALVLGIWALGAILMLGSQRSFWLEQFRRHRWMWLCAISVCMTVCVVMVMQRPRPSYMFSFSVVMIAFTGMSLWAIARQWLKMSLWPGLGPIAMLAVLLLVPGYWTTHTDRPRRLLDQYRILDAHRELFDLGAAKTAVPFRAEYLASYLSRGIRPDMITLPSLISLQEATGEQLSAALDSAGVRVVLVDQSLMGWNAVRQFMATASDAEWKPAARGGDCRARRRQQCQYRNR